MIQVVSVDLVKERPRGHQLQFHANLQTESGDGCKGWLSSRDAINSMLKGSSSAAMQNQATPANIMCVI